MCHAVIETGRNTLIGEGDRRLGKVVVQDSDGVSAFYDGFVYGFPSELPAYVVIHANVDLGDGTTRPYWLIYSEAMTALCLSP